jgi:hypothetical protein
MTPGMLDLSALCGEVEMPRLFFTTRATDCRILTTRPIERTELRFIVHIYCRPVLYFEDYAFSRINFKLNDIPLSNFNIT